MDNPIKTDFSCNLAEEWKLNKGVTQAQPEVPAEGQWAGTHVGHSQAAPPAVSAECGAGVGPLPSRSFFRQHTGCCLCSQHRLGVDSTPSVTSKLVYLLIFPIKTTYNIYTIL